MGSAWKNSLGGCCCKPPGGCFDLYGLVSFDTRDMLPSQHPTGLTRYGVMWPAVAEIPISINTADKFFNAWSRLNWAWEPEQYIPNNRLDHYAQGSLVGGQGGGYDSVWTIEVREPRGVSRLYVCNYHSITGERTVIQFTAPPGQQGPTIRFPVVARYSLVNRPEMAAANKDEFVNWFSTGGFRVFRLDGTTDFYSEEQASSTYLGQYEGGGFAGDPVMLNNGSYPWLISGRDWPWCCGIQFRQRKVVHPLDNFSYIDHTDIRFVRAKLVVESGVMKFPRYGEGGDVIYEFTTAANLYSTSSSSEPNNSGFVARWVSFDSTYDGTKNVGVLAYYLEDNAPYYQLPGQPPKVLRCYVSLVINDEIVETYSALYDGSAFAGDLGQIVNFALKCYPSGGAIHSCYDGGCFVPKFDFASPPIFNGSSTFMNPNRPQIGIRYDEHGGEQWRSIPVANISCANSSYEWLHMRGHDDLTNLGPFLGFAPSGTFPNEQYTMGFDRNNEYWFVKPDGSQSVPTGHLHRFGELTIFPNRKYLGNYDCVKENTIPIEQVPGVMPADIADLDAALRGSAGVP